MKSFKTWDIYYLYEYAYSFMLHGDGDIKLIYFENKCERFCYVVMQKDISNDKRFASYIDKEKYYDWETPYGYGGPLSDEPISEKTQEIFGTEITKYCRANNIVSQFIRFHPLLENHELLYKVIEQRYLRDTIFMDVSIDKEHIFLNLDSKNRNMIRKAQKNGVTIEEKSIDDIDEFINMYNETMVRNGAEKYYIFQREYFDYLKSIGDNIRIFYAMREGIPISGALIYFNEWFAHYHLSGSKAEYRKYSSSNLLLYEVACWAHKLGIKKFHLGGGMSPNDSLFGFKKQFNKNGRLPFVVGKTIFDIEKYNELLNYRTQMDSEFDRNNDFMIQYRG